MLFIILALAFVSVFLLLLAVAKPGEKEDVESRLGRLRALTGPLRLKPTLGESEPDKTQAQIANLNAQLDAIFTPLAGGRLSVVQTGKLNKLIVNAGRKNLTPLGIRLWQFKLLAIVPLVGALLVIPTLGFDWLETPLLLLLFAAAGYFYPILALKREATQRARLIMRALPGMLDLLTICVEAGMSLQAGLLKWVEKGRPGPLRDEFDQVLREVRLGRSRADALKQLAKRIDLKEINSVVLSMVQAEAMGTSIAKALRVQAEIARENRWTRAQEQAFKAPVKLTFPLVFFIFPTIFLVIFGPVALELITNMAAGK
jgi:pilus assembly protein TadC